MFRRAAILIVIIGLVVGLAASAWKYRHPARSFETCEELGYVIEYEIDPMTQHIHQSNPDRDGKEYVGVIVQGHYSLQVLDGRVTLNREPRGTAKKGDRLRVTRDLRLWVNEMER